MAKMIVGAPVSEILDLPQKRILSKKLLQHYK